MSPNEHRVIVVAPTGRDSELICQLLRTGGETCIASSSVPDAFREAASGVGATLFADEALDGAGLAAINRFRESQPPWSDLPMLVLTRRGDGSEGAHRALRELGQVAVIERPVGRRPLLSSVQAALRARTRQYEARAQMAELERIGEELRVANAMKDELLGLVSHELRTPLTGILGCSHLLLRRFAELKAEDREGLLRDIHDHGTRLQRLIENMLVLSRAESAAETNTEPLLLQRVLPPVFEALSPLQGGKRLRVIFEEQLPPVTANPVFIEQVLTNLVRNSEKYAAENADVEVRVEAHADSVAITVADTGAVLDQGQVDQMFEPFYRDPEHAPRVSGLGLGLPVCKRLTEVQGGAISARPRPGGGLQVTIALPKATE